jgi:hypothetical protein
MELGQYIFTQFFGSSVGGLRVSSNLPPLETSIGPSTSYGFACSLQCLSIPNVVEPLFLVEWVLRLVTQVFLPQGGSALALSGYGHDDSHFLAACRCLDIFGGSEVYPARSSWKIIGIIVLPALTLVGSEIF